MANGFAPYLLKSLITIAGQNYPGFKLTPAGFLAMLLENSNIADLRITNAQGHKKEIKVKYKVRNTEATVFDEDNCDIDFVPAYKEANVTNDKIVKTGFHISLETVSKYMEEASQTQSIGTPSTPVIREITDTIAHAANSIIMAIDAKLLSAVTWGTNVTTGNNAAKTLNIGKDNTKYVLDSGFPMLFNDAFQNEFNGQLLIVGGGLMNAHELTRMQNAMFAAQNGIDLSKFTGYKFYPDLKSQTYWGANNIGVFSPGAIHLVDFQKYVSFQSGRLGNSWFAQISLPVNTGNGQTEMTFDLQVKELDCPTPLFNSYGEESVYDRGYGVYISKRVGLFQLPSDSYASDDRLANVNGALRYNVTNECENCD